MACYSALSAAVASGWLGLARRFHGNVWPRGFNDIRQMDRAAHLRAQRDAHLAERQRQLEDEERRIEQQEDTQMLI